MFRRVRTPHAIEALFADHFDAIYRFATCRVGLDAAADIAAETFAQALRSAERMDPARDARPWLFGIASNVIRHHRRAEQRRIRGYVAAEHQYDVVGGNGRPESEILLRTHLVDALARLDARDRDALLLFAWADLTYDEIATALGIPIGTVRSRINRARRIVREGLGDSGVSNSGELVVAAREET
jgi:RNA polymerase sigma factor (sigma-70 family)